MRIRTFLLWAALLIISFGSNSQNRNIDCGTDYYYSEMSKTNPEIAEQLNMLRNITDYPENKYRSNDVRIIPVVFHIIHANGPENIDDSKVRDMITQLNIDFRKNNADTSIIRSIFKDLAADTKIEFRLARIGPDGKCSNGINRYYSTLTENARDNVKALIRWPNSMYLNVWVVKSIYNYGASGTILGYATLPGGPSSLDGIVMRADRVGLGYRTLTHEIGHWLGLYHTFQDGCAGNCKTTGDLICDTPPVAEENFGCEMSTNSCNNDSPDLPDMLENHMDYTDCRVMFTYGQKERIDYFLLNSRSNLYSNTNLMAVGLMDSNNISCKLVADFTSDQNTICAGSLINFKDQSKVSSVLSYKWYFPGGLPETSNMPNPTVRYNAEGVYSVKLILTNSLGKDSIEKQKFITTYPYYGEIPPYSENFDNPTFPATYWHTEPPKTNVGWKKNSLASVSGIYSFYVNNYIAGSGSESYSFILPPLDIRGILEPQLDFYYAHARKSSSTKDNLTIYASNTCGQTWSLRYSKNFTKLPTIPYFVSTEYIPDSIHEWKYETLSLANYGNEKNLLLKFIFTGEAGNNIFIDNINIGSANSVSNTELKNRQAYIYPSPVVNDFILFTGINTPGTLQIIINDLAGKRLSVNTVQNNNGIIPLSVSQLNIFSDGIYLLTVQSEDRSYSIRIPVIHQ